MAVNNNTHVKSQTIRIPAMIFPFHVTPVDGLRFASVRSRARYYTAFRRGEYWKLYASKFMLCYADGMLIMLRRISVLSENGVQL
jgi:hypothetical protein